MAVTTLTVTFALLALLNCRATLAQTQARGLRNVGQGYNILTANPDLVPLNGSAVGVLKDPGFTGKSILKLTYQDGKKDMFGQYSIADQVSFRASSGCAQEQNMVFNSEHSYRKLLLKNYHTSGLEVFQDTAFGRGMGFHDPHTNVYHESKAVCRYGKVSYESMNPASGVHRLDDAFVNDICALDGAQQSAYLALLDKYGTHIVMGAELGYPSFSRRVVTLGDFLSALDSVQTGSDIKYDLGFPTIYLTVYANKLLPYINRLFGSEKTIWSIENTQDPVPVYYELSRLSSMIGSQLPIWGDVCKQAARKSCCESMPTIRFQLDSAIRIYAERKGVRPTSDDSHLLQPLQWPMGTYGLPKSDLGCPEEAGFKWTHGKVIQYMGGWMRADNEASSYNHFPRGAITDDVARQYFCMKSSTTASAILHWEKGSYCIYKSGACPRGFKDGSVYFDDNSKDNWNTGDLPEGTYADASTEIKFCCREDGDATESIVLPIRHSFYLIRKGTVCQKVHKTRLSMDSITFSRPYFGASDYIKSGSSPYMIENNNYLRLFYCYYEPERTGSLKFALKTEQSD